MQNPNDREPIERRKGSKIQRVEKSKEHGENQLNIISFMPVISN